MALQRSYSVRNNKRCSQGGTAKNSSFFGTFIQAKFRAGQTNDVYEQEADHFASRVAGMQASEQATSFFKPVQTTSLPQKDNCNPDPKYSTVQQTLNGKGEPMDRSTRLFMERRFGHDLSDVQIHNDSLAHQSSESISALAFTHGSHIVFAEGQYAPRSAGGKKLLAHELTHVIQQKSGGGAPSLQRCASAAEVPVFNNLAIGIRAMAQYKSLGPADKKLVDEIIALSGSRNNCIQLLATVINMLSVRTLPAATIGANAVTKGQAEVQKAETRLKSPGARQLSVLEEQKSFRHRKKFKGVAGREGTIYYVDNSNPTNIVVKIFVRLNGVATEIGKLKKLEDDIEKAAAAPGFMLDLVFVSTSGPDIFEVNTDPSKWTDAGNLRADDPMSLAHEVLHLLGLPDRYDYLAHATNDEMPLSDRIYWVRESFNIDPKEIDPHSIMGDGFSVTNKDACAAAKLDATTCNAVRSKAGYK